MCFMRYATEWCNNNGTHEVKLLRDDLITRDDILVIQTYRVTSIERINESASEAQSKSVHQR